MKFEFLGAQVCATAYERLLGIGSSRFESIRKAVLSNQRSPPVDLRYLKEKKAVPKAARAAAVSYLQEPPTLRPYGYSQQ